MMRLLIVSVLLLSGVAGCSKDAGSNDDLMPAAAAVSTDVRDRALDAEPSVVSLSPRVAAMWSRSCALCHVDGNAGAPRLGIAEEWLPRLAKGEANLLQNTLEGFNGMPPLGYCMACEHEDFLAMIRFMAGVGDSVETDQ